jgi:hypothetical protein
MSQKQPAVVPEDFDGPLVPESSAFDALAESTGSVPWWIISGAFHGLLLLLVTLISMTLIGPATADVMLDVVIVKPKPEEPPTPNPWHPVQTSFQIESEMPPVDHTMIVHDDVEVDDHIETADDMDSAKCNGESPDMISDVALSGVGISAAIGWGGGPAGAYGHRDEGGRRRRTIKEGGDAGTDRSFKEALRWLARHQEPDGRWDTLKYGASVKTDTACTGLALLSFLGSGHTEKVGPYRENVRRAVAWLKSKQNAEGLVFDSTDAGDHRGVGYPHAIAGMALAEAAGMARVADTVQAAQRAIDYSTKVHQQGEGYERLGFRYQPKQAGDLSVTGWYVMQLKSAKVSGLKVDVAAFDGAIRFLDSVEKKGAGGDQGYGPASIYWYQPTDEHGHSAHRLTAIGTLCRQFLGWKEAELAPSVEWFANKGGVPNGWGEGKTDLYYWYYGSLCTFLQGGEVWKRWNAGMKKTLCDNQRVGGDEAGSWDPVGDYSNEWGRVGQTALACLCLEIYFRNLPIYR